MITIGQKGKLGNEVLTIVSFNEKTFTCDNGKSYMIAFSKWMTEGKTVSALKPKRAKKVNGCEEGFYEKEVTIDEMREFDEYCANAKYRQAGSSLRK